MAMRLSGLMSGMDTESIVAQLVEAKKTKVTKAVKAQKTLKYKQDAWKTLNAKIVNLYDKALGNMRFESAFRKKTTKVSNSSVVSVITGENAMNSVQSLNVDKLATTGFLTGGKLPETVKGTDKDGNEIDVALSGSTTLKQLGLKLGDGNTGSFTVSLKGKDAKSTNVTVGDNTTIDSFISTLREVGLNVNLDANNGRIYISAKSSGAGNDFEIKANNAGGFAALEALGLGYGYDASKLNTLKTDYEAKAAYGNEETAQRVAKKLSDLTSSRQALLNKRTQLLNYAPALSGKLTNTGIQIGADFDYDKLTDEQKKQLNDALKAVAEEEKASGTEEGAANAKALESWVSDWRSMSKSLKNVESQLDLADPDNIKLSADAAKKIETEVNNEKAAAKEALEWLKKVDTTSAEYQSKKAKGEDAEIRLNGVAYTSDKNTFSINGLTLTVSAKTAENETVTITTEDDVSGVYDMIKDFLKDYNALINEMDKLYNADSAKGYEPLTDEEKDAMSDSQIEEWETKIKDSILRKDSNLNSISSLMKRIMMEGVEVNGKKMYLSNFGINTLSYFSAPENEKNAYHIDGDPDDVNTSGNADVLKSMIANDPDTVISFFTQLSNTLREEMFEQMKGTEYSSVLTAYEDKKMQTDYDDYTTKIKELEKKLADYEDKWYAKFAAMETAMAKMQNNASAVTALLGG